MFIGNSTKIRKGEELCLSYGDDYWDAMRSVMNQAASIRQSLAPIVESLHSVTLQLVASGRQIGRSTLAAAEYLRLHCRADGGLPQSIIVPAQGTLGSDDGAISHIQSAVSASQTESTFEVERIMQKRLGDGGRPEYKVRWKGFSAEHDSWLPLENFTDHDPDTSIVAAFERGGDASIHSAGHPGRDSSIHSAGHPEASPCCPKCKVIVKNSVNLAVHVSSCARRRTSREFYRCTAAERQARTATATKKSSKFKGVAWDKRYRKWYVQISIRGVRTYLGTYTDEADAARAYDKAALRVGRPTNFE